MNTWRGALREGAVAGTVACVLSVAVLAAAGRRQAGSAVAPLNAVSHWLWGEESLHENRATLRHTLLGYATHHLASIFWAGLYSLLWGHRQQAKRLPQAIAGAAATSAVAWVVDYRLVPKRLTPGYEHRLSSGGMWATYGALAAGLALGALLLRRR